MLFAEFHVCTELGKWHHEWQKLSPVERARWLTYFDIVNEEFEQRRNRDDEEANSNIETRTDASR